MKQELGVLEASISGARPQVSFLAGGTGRGGCGRQSGRSERGRRGRRIERGRDTSTGHDEPGQQPSTLAPCAGPVLIRAGQPPWANRLTRAPASRPAGRGQGPPAAAWSERASTPAYLSHAGWRAASGGGRAEPGIERERGTEGEREEERHAACHARARMPAAGLGLCGCRLACLPVCLRIVLLLPPSAIAASYPTASSRMPAPPPGLFLFPCPPPPSASSSAPHIPSRPSVSRAALPARHGAVARTSIAASSSRAGCCCCRNTPKQHSALGLISTLKRRPARQPA